MLHSISLQIYSAQSLQAKIYLEPPIAMWIFLASTLNMCKVKGESSRDRSRGQYTIVLHHHHTKQLLNASCLAEMRVTTIKIQLTHVH